MEPDLRASVVICAHDLERLPWLIDAAESVLAQEPAPEELVIVVDHQDELRRAALDALPGVEVIPSTEAPGLSGARNTGIRATTGEIVAFLDDDAVARPGWLAGLLDAYEDPAVLGTGGAIVPAWEADQPSWFPDEYLWVVGCTYRGVAPRRATVRNPIGCSMSFRRSVFEQVGGFHHAVGRGSGLPLGCEETELCIRAAAAVPDGRFILEPGSVVDHHVPRRRGRIRYFLVRCYSEGISKAYVVRLAGAGAGLSSERTYLARTLTSGIARQLGRVVRGSPTGLARAAMIVVGLGAFAVGYVRGTARFAGVDSISDVSNAASTDE